MEVVQNPLLLSGFRIRGVKTRRKESDDVDFRSF